LQDLLAGRAATSRQPQVAELHPAPLQHPSRDSRPKSLPAASRAGAQWPSDPVERPAGTPPQPRRIEATTLTTRTAWQMVLERLQETMSAANYGTWLSQSLLISCDRSKAIVGAPSGFIVEHLAKRFSNPIKKELSAVVGFHPQQIDYLTLSELGLLSPNGQHPESTSPS